MGNRKSVAALYLTLDEPTLDKIAQNTKLNRDEILTLHAEFIVSETSILILGALARVFLS